MSRSRIVTLVGVLVLAAAAIWFVKGRGRADAPKYRTAAIEQGDLTATVSATGSVRPVVEVQVGSQVSGTISALNADYNSRVHSGQLLAQIDPSSFQSRVVQAEATVAHADAALKDGRRQLARAQELLKGNYVAQADVDAAQATVDQRNADLMQANAQLHAARLDLAHTTIRSPIDGVVISRSVDVGQTVAASLQAPQLFVIANDLAQMQVETRIDEADIGRIKPGLPVRFTVDAFPDATFEGSVSQVRLEPITDQNVVTYTTVMRTRNDDMRLRPGMTANVTVMVESRQNVMKVANAALRFRPQSASGGSGGGMNGGAGGRGGASGRSGANGPGGAPGDGARGGRRGFSPVGSAQAQVPAAQSQGQGQAGGGGRGGHRGQQGGAEFGTRPGATPGESSLKPGTLYVLRNGRPAPVDVLTGITDGTATEIQSDVLKPGMLVILGLDLGGTAARGQQLTPPPGMGGPMFRGGRR